MKNFCLFSILVLNLIFSANGQPFTPKGTNVSGHIFTYSFSAATLAYITQQTDSIYSNITILENSTNDYNCHGWAWLYSEGGARIGIKTPGDDAFWNDGSYAQTASTDGEKISYPAAGDHSAIQSGTPGWFISKWGPGPKVRHTPLNVPSGYLAGGTNLTYYNCNFYPQILTARVDNGTIYNTTGGMVGIPTTPGAHALYVSGQYAWSYSFYAQDPGVSITGPTFGGTNFNFTGPVAARIRVTASNSCATTERFIAIYLQSGGRLAVYPNPSNGETNVGVEDDMTRADNAPKKTMKNLYLYDEHNNLVKDYGGEIKNTWLKINTASFKTGTYYVKAVYEDGSTETTRVLVGTR